MMIKAEIGIASLEGRIFLLDAVDFERVEVEKWGGFEDANTIRFRLDGNVYVAVEDPNDGYRSSMEHLFIDDTGKSPMKNVFSPIEVRAEHRTEGPIRAKTTSFC